MDDYQLNFWWCVEGY